ncbi:MAG: class I SAM-dependent methyltransferase, partial [Bacteroidota bacterium]
LPAHPGLLRIVEANRAEYAAWMKLVNKYSSELQAIRPASLETDNTKPGWNNGFLPGLDIMALYTIIAETKPARYVEVGSGNSTRVAYKAVREHSPDTKIISIDPYPRAEIDHLASEIIRKPFENSDITWLSELEPGD